MPRGRGVRRGRGRSVPYTRSQATSDTGAASGSGTQAQSQSQNPTSPQIPATSGINLFSALVSQGHPSDNPPSPGLFGGLVPPTDTRSLPQASDFALPNSALTIDDDLRGSSLYEFRDTWFGPQNRTSIHRDDRGSSKRQAPTVPPQNPQNHNNVHAPSYPSQQAPTGPPQHGGRPPNEPQAPSGPQYATSVQNFPPPSGRPVSQPSHNPRLHEYNHNRSRSDITPPATSPKPLYRPGQLPHHNARPLSNDYAGFSRPKSQYDIPGSPSHASQMHNMRSGVDNSPYRLYGQPPKAAPKPQRPTSMGNEPQLSASLSTAIIPLLVKLREEYREEYRINGRPMQRTEVVDELRNAFDLAERSCPGIADDVVTGVISRLGGLTLSDSDIRRAVDRVKRPV